MATQLLRHAALYFKIIAVSVIVTVFSLIFLSAAWAAFSITRPLKTQLCCETPAHFGANFESIRFATSDGLMLSGWYLPPKNGAVIILIHSYHGDRRQTLPVAEMLYKNGYGLLMYDQRASGESQGLTRSLGWLDIPDVGAAAAWLQTRQKDVKIGAYGCSMGAAIALAGAVREPAIQALVVDAPSPLEWSENLPNFSLRDPVSLPVIALYYPMVMLRTGILPPTSTSDAARDYGARPILFISSGQPGEFSRVNAYFETAVGTKEHWNLPDAKHCSGPADHPEEYQDRLVIFFNSAMR